MSGTANLGIQRLSEGAANNAAVVNAALNILDAVTGGIVATKGANTAPVSPTEGAAYIVGTAPTGIWLGKANYIAYYYGSTWQFIAPKDGLRFYCQADNDTYVYAGGAWQLWLKTSVALLQHQTAANANAGATTATTWVTRPITTEVFDPDGIVSLSGNTFILIPGRYRIRVVAPGIRCDAFQARLYNITGAAVVATGTTGFSPSVSGWDQPVSEISAYVDITAATTFRVEQYATTSQATGLGYGSTTIANVYMNVEITRLP